MQGHEARVTIGVGLIGAGDLQRRALGDRAEGDEAGRRGADELTSPTSHPARMTAR
jgi:hypothetical protein